MTITSNLMNVIPRLGIPNLLLRQQIYNILKTQKLIFLLALSGFLHT